MIYSPSLNVYHGGASKKMNKNYFFLQNGLMYNLETELVK